MLNKRVCKYCMSVELVNNGIRSKKEWFPPVPWRRVDTSNWNTHKLVHCPCKLRAEDSIYKIPNHCPYKLEQLMDG